MGIKITELAAATAAAINDLAMIVVDPGGAAVSRKIEIGDLLTLRYAQVSTDGGSGSQTPGTGYALMNQWASNGVSSTGVTADAGNDKITIADSGHYLVLFNLSFTGTNGSVVNARAYWNGVGQPQIGFQRKLGTGSDVGVAPAFGIVNVTTGGTDIDVRVKCDGAGDVFDLVEGQLFVVRVGNA